jgi:hypothetical protein
MILDTTKQTYENKHGSPIDSLPGNGIDSGIRAQGGPWLPARSWTTSSVEMRRPLLITTSPSGVETVGSDGRLSWNRDKTRLNLLEVRQGVGKNGQIEERVDRKPVLDRYWLLLKYGCNLEFDRGSRVWQAATDAVTARDSLVHYNVAKAPSLTSSRVWTNLEAVMLLFIAPSTLARRTLLSHQFDHYGTLVRLRPLISEFEERPLHKGCLRNALIFHCPFDGIDETKYPSRWKS